jgi:CO/xanthine dehydrogenase Mo-binding subunit
MDVPAAYYLAQTTGRPVKFVATSYEDLIAMSPRHPSVVTLRSGLRRDGTIVAREARVVFNSGAYGAFKPSANGMLGGAGRAAGSYAIPDLLIRGYCVYTNQVPCGYMRAPGSPQVLFAVEAHTDLLARELGMDPVEFRLRNLPATSHGGAESLAPRVLRAAAEALGWSGAGGDRHEAGDGGSTSSRLIGRGVAMAERGTGVGTGSSDITLNPDGTITAVTSMPDNGTGGLTTVAQVVAEAWGVPFERVHLVRGDTDSLPIDVESGASRMTNVAGHSAILASQQVQTQLAPLAAELLGAASAEWDRGGWRAPDGRFLPLDELALEVIKQGDPVAHAQVTHTTPRSPDLAYCVQGAEVEVDPETGEVHLRRFVDAQDVGTIINAIGHQSQIEGSVVQGVGFGLMEELASDQGTITTANLGEYKLPTVADIPTLATVNVPAAGPGPFAARSIGELPHIPTAAAITNAVADAIGAPIFALPITAERVLDALESK